MKATLTVKMLDFHNSNADGKLEPSQRQHQSKIRSSFLRLESTNTTLSQNFHSPLSLSSRGS